MKTLNTIIFTAILFVLVNPVSADDRGHHRGKENRDNHTFIDHARVLKVETIYRTVKVSQPRTECWDEHKSKPIKRQVRGESKDGLIAGGIIGGVIGHQLGSGHGKDVATIAGTLIGAAIGQDQGTRTENTGEYYTEHKERCRTVTDYKTEQQLDGYEVTYKYQGEIFHARMDRHPGRRVRVNVQVSPVD